MKKLFLSLLVVLLPLVALADAVEIDGIYYNLIEKAKEAEVTRNPNYYTGSVDIPDSVTYDGVEYSVTSIGNAAFWECNKLTSITIPNNVTSIGESAFSSCTSLTSISIPSSVTSIGKSAFYRCSGLTKVYISDLATWCGISFKWVVNGSSNPLYYAQHLYLNGVEIKELLIPDSVTSIGTYTFHGCSSLTAVSIPNSVATIGAGAFEGCRGLSSITIPNSVTSIGSSAFYLCSNLASINIPNGVTSIEYSSFKGCKSLTSVTIPNSVTTIEQEAFSGCSAMSFLIIGSAVRNISMRSFSNCQELADVYCLAENVPYTYNDAFQGSYIEHANLHVPIGSVQAYKEKEPWKNFKEIVALEGETPETPKCATPTISYQNGQLIFESESEGAEFVSEITDTDIKKHYDAKVSLTATYTITVYATKSGYDNSDVATAALCWIDQQPKTEGITDGLAQIPARPVLIKTDRGQITVEGVEDHTNITLFTTDGKLAGSSISQNGSASIDTHLPSGTSTIVRIGEKSVKILVK